jgi:hypothetical protein
MSKRDLTKQDLSVQKENAERIPDSASDLLPHKSHLKYIFLRRLIRGSLGAIPGIGSILVETTIGVREEIKLNKDLTELSRRVEEIQQQVGEAASTKEDTAGLQAQDALESGKPGELPESVIDIVSCLDHPSELPSGDLKPVVERYAALQRVSQGRLLSKRKPNRREGINIVVGDLKIGALFFPLSFLRQNMTTQARGLRLPDPFKALFEPEDCKGFSKWICVECANDQFVVRAYPKPIRLDPAGRTRLMDEVTVDPAQRFNSFEYWPDGAGREKIKFVAEMHFGQPFQLQLQEKGKPDSPLLTLALLYLKE